MSTLGHPFRGTEFFRTLQWQFHSGNQGIGFSLHTWKHPSNGGNVWVIRDWKTKVMGELMMLNSPVPQRHIFFFGSLGLVGHIQSDSPMTNRNDG